MLTDSGKFVRASKYRHVFGQAAKKELCYENLKITKNAWDSNIITTNGKYLAVNWDASGGGAFAIIPLLEVGKAPDTVPLFRGHTGPVLDTAFNPFNQQQVVSCSDDGNILLWNIPEDFSFRHYVDENDQIKDVTEPAKVLKGHKRKVGHVAFHPCAENILASCSMDYTVKIWDLGSGECKITLPHKDLVTSFSFNYNGSLLATTSRDKKLRIWDVRKQEVLSEGPAHTGAKPARVVWAGNTDRVITTGFSRLSDRQVGVWDAEDISKGPIGGFMYIDASSGVLIPVFDESNNILYLAGKGDGNIRYYEYDKDELYELSQFPSTDPQRGFAWTPKTSCNLKENEILRSFKTVNDQTIEPVSFIVPRKSDLFQEDIYPDAPSSKPALTASEWLDGKDVNGPLLVKLAAFYEGTSPEVTEPAPAVSISEVKKEAAAEKEKASAAKKEAAAQKESATPAPASKEVKSETPKAEAKKEEEQSPGKVDNLLNKVVYESDDEDSQRIRESNDRDDDWEEEEKAKKASEPVKSEIPLSNEKEASKDSSKDTSKEYKTAKEESANKPEKAEEPQTSFSKEVKKDAGKADAAIEASEKKTEAPVDQNKVVESKKAEPEAAKKESTEAESSSPRKDTSSEKAGAPTLRGTVDRFAKLVESLEKQITILTEANADKNSRISELEAKVEKLLKQ